MADIRRSKDNTYFAKQNHLPLKKSEVTKPKILADGVSRLEGLGKTIRLGDWTPAALFADDDDGVWLNPGPKTAFLSTTDLTPSGDGDPVGFLLDESQGAGYSGGKFTGLGPELVTNGSNLVDTTGWSPDGPSALLSANSGNLRVTYDVSGGDTDIWAEQLVSLVVGAVYQISYEVVGRTAGRWAVFLSNDDYNTGQSIALGKYTATFVASSSSTSLKVGIGPFDRDDGEYVEFNNISIREIPGHHATQPTAARRMTLRQTAGGLWYLERDTVDDRLDISLQLEGFRWTAGMAYVPDGEDWMVIHRTGTNNPWVGVGLAGSSSTTLAAGATQNAIFFENIVSAETTRGGQYTLSQPANTVILDFNATDNWPSVSIGEYNAGVYTTPGDIYSFVLIDRELTTQERSDLQSFFESRVPL